jgi:hypothetical protein
MYCLEEWTGEQRISPPGDNFTPPGDKIHPWGTASPLGSKFAPRSEVKNGPLLSTTLFHDIIPWYKHKKLIKEAIGTLK